VPRNPPRGRARTIPCLLQPGRLQAFQAVGTDVLYAPGPKDMLAITTLVSAVPKPVNVVMSHADTSITAAEPHGSRRQTHHRQGLNHSLRHDNLPDGGQRDGKRRSVQIHQRCNALQDFEGCVRRCRRQTLGPNRHGQRVPSVRLKWPSWRVSRRKQYTPARDQMVPSAAAVRQSMTREPCAAAIPLSTAPRINTGQDNERS
jgi:hypothetical protein